METNGHRDGQRRLRRGHILWVIAGALALLMTAAPVVASVETPSFPSPAVATKHESGRQYSVAVPPEMFPWPGIARGASRMAAMRTQFKRAGACWLRTDVDIKLVKAIDRYRWLGSSGPCPAKDSHLRVIGILDYYTLWSADKICPTTRFSRRTDLAEHFTLADWRKLTQCVAKRLKGRVAAWEVWNEPLLAQTQFGYQDGSVGHYLDLLRVASRQIRKVDPRAKIIAMGGVDAYAAGAAASRVAAAERFSRRLAAKGAARYADAVSVHAYGWGDYGPDRLDAFARSIRLHRKVWNRPVWVTEIGHRTTDPGSQSGFLTATYGALLGAGAERIVWFAMKDARDGRFGIVGREVQTTMREYISTPKSGLLRVFTDPPVKSTINVAALDANPRQSFSRAWGIDWERLQEGRYQVAFSDWGDLEGQPVVEPATRTLLVRPNQVVHLKVDPQDGSVQTYYCWEGQDPCP
jgi:hypothetical protein